MSGLLTFFHYVHDGQGEVTGLSGARGASISPDGVHFFVAGENANALTSFSIHSGSLGFVESFEDGLNGVFGLRGASSTVVSPDGRHVYVACREDNSLVVFGRDATADEISFLEVLQDGSGGIFGLHGASSVTVSPDNKNVIVASGEDAALVVLSRDATSDELTMQDLDILPLSLYGASSVAISPDGSNVYATATAESNHTMVTFVRDLSTGDLDFADEIVNDVNGVSGLRGLTSATVSPDGTHVYAAAQLDNAVAVFERDLITGNLTFVGVLQDEVDGMTGLEGASAVLVSPAGDRLFAASSVDNAVTVFRRTPGTGELALLETVDNIIGLEGASSLAMSSSGEFLYVTGAQAGTVIGFEVAACIGDPASGDADFDAFCDDVDSCIGDDLSGDSDGDQVCDNRDLCPGFDDGIDSDADGVPDGCDQCIGDDSTGDSDGDGVCDDSDNCPGMDDSTCTIFVDSFESANTAAWSSSTP